MFIEVHVPREIGALAIFVNVDRIKWFEEWDSGTRLHMDDDTTIDCNEPVGYVRSMVARFAEA